MEEKGKQGRKRKKRKKKVYKMSRTKTIDFERIEGEILRVSNENQAETGKK